MARINIFILFFLLTISMFAQPMTFISQPTVLQSPNINHGTVYGTGGVSDTLKLKHLNGYNDIVVSSVTSTSGLITIDPILVSRVLHADSGLVTYTVNTATAGDYVIPVEITHSGYNSPMTVNITVSVEPALENFNLIAESSINFGTTTQNATDYLTISNPSSVDITIQSYNEYASPFFVDNKTYVLSAGASHDLRIDFYATQNGTYNDTIKIIHSGDNSPTLVPLAGIWSADTFSTQVQWASATPGTGGWWKSLEVDPVSGRLYIVGDLSGLFYSDDDGDSWTLSSNNVNYAFSDVIVLAGGDTVLTAGNGGIFRSLDGAVTWTRVGDDVGEGAVYPAIEYSTHKSDNTKNHTFASIESHQADSRVIYAGTGFTHDTDESLPDAPLIVVKSTDGGATWTDVTNGIETLANGTGDFATDPTNVNIVYVGTNQGIYKTTNGGTSWTKILNKRCKRVAVEPDEPNKIWASFAWSPSLYYSDDYGATWTDVRQNVGIYWSEDPVENPANTTGEEYYFIDIKFSKGGDTVYVANRVKGEDVFYTVDNGLNWTAFNLPADQSQWKPDNTLSNANFLAISPFNANTIYYGHTQVFRSYNHGSTWDCISSNDNDGDGYYASRGIEILEYFDIAFDPFNSNKIIQSVWDNDFLLSQDGGVSWKQSNARTLGRREGYCMTYDPNNQNVLYGFTAYNDAWDEAILVKSTDGGLNWSNLTTDLPVGNWHDLVVLKSGRMIAMAWYPISGGARSVYTSTNNGVNWTKLFDGYMFTEIGVSSTQQDTLYVTGSARDDGGSNPLWKSVNGGVNWTGLAPTNLGVVNGIAINPNNANTIIVAQGEENINLQKYVTSGLYKSTDGGTTFTSVLSGATKESFRDVLYDVNDANRLFACSEMYGHISGTPYDKNLGGKVYVSNDGGTTWSDFSRNIAGAGRFNQLAQSPNGELFVLTEGQGAYKISPSGVEVTAPVISSVTVDKYYASNSATVNVTFSNTGGYLNAKSFVGTDTLEWDVNMDAMTVSGNTASFQYQGLSQDVTYYAKVKLTNEIGSTSSIAQTFSLTSGTAVIDTLSVVSDVHVAYSTAFYDFNYINFGNGNSHSGLVFGGFSNLATVDSVKVEFTANANSTANDLLLKLAFQDAMTSSAFIDRADFDTRSANLTTAQTTLDYDTDWVAGSKYQFFVTSSLAEINSSYTMNNQNITLFVLDTGTITGALKAVKSSEDAVVGNRPILIIYGTR